MLGRLIGIFLVGMLGCAAAAAAESPFLGKWDITGTTPSGPVIYWLEVREEAGQWVGYFLNRGGSVLKLPEIRIENDELVFALATKKPEEPRPVHRAKVIGGQLIGLLTVGNQKIEWTGVRPPQWGSYDANAKHRFGPAVTLFDGKSLSGWNFQHPNRPGGWTVAEGIMANEEKANNLVSTAKFMNFKIQVEYRVGPKSNSGIYLRGRYELQVLDDAGQPTESHGHMGLYSRVAPLVNASKPAGEWQAMEAVIVGNRLTVSLNGQKVHDNVIIEGITGGALDCREGEPGPIMIQGDHGKVWVRKVVVTPILD